jgi:hypothetical protein
MTVTARPELFTRPAQWSALIPIEASLGEWHRTIEQIPVILNWIGKNNIVPASHLFNRFRRFGNQSDPFSVEIGFALAEAVEVSNPVHLVEMEGGTYLKYLHRGHPDGLFDIDPQLRRWASENAVHLDVANDSSAEIWKGRYEFFLTNPYEVPDPHNWEIKLAWLTRC